MMLRGFVTSLRIAATSLGLLALLRNMIAAWLSGIRPPVDARRNDKPPN